MRCSSVFQEVVQSMLRCWPTVLLAAVGAASGVWGYSPQVSAADGVGGAETPLEHLAPQPDPTRQSESAAPTAISGPRDLLRLLGIDQSHWDHLADGVPWQLSEDDLLLTIMFRFRDFRMLQIEQWAHRRLPLSELTENPDAYRGEIVRLRGRVTRAEALEPLAEVVERFEMSEYYRCDFLLADGRQAVVFSRTIPQAWKRDEPIDERAGAYGLFLKLGRSEDKRPLPIFVAPRIAWHPPTRLGNLEMDVGLFDDLRGRPRGGDPRGRPDSAPRRSLDDMRLTARSRECFYQMLAAMGRARPGQLLEEAQNELKRIGGEKFSVVPLFNEPSAQHGRLVVLSGTAREVLPIPVDDEDIRARFGIDHYYQVALFTEDSQGNPLVFCVREIPDGMPTGGGPRFGEYVTVAGFFFNTWAYRSRLPAEMAEGRSSWQLAPLLIGRELFWYPPQEPAGHPMASAIAAGVFVFVLFGIWLVLWRYSRGDRRFRDSVLAKRMGPRLDLELDQLDAGDDASAPAKQAPTGEPPA